jgi:hypothetical protein
MKQSDERVPGRRRSGPPPSFGRAAEEQKQPAEDFTIRGGEAFHLVLHVDVTPSAESLAALRAAVAENTRAGVIEGYAQAFAQMDQEPEEQPGGGDGGAPPGPDEAGGDGS